MTGYKRFPPDPPIKKATAVLIAAILALFVVVASARASEGHAVTVRELTLVVAHMGPKSRASVACLSPKAWKSSLKAQNLLGKGQLVRGWTNIYARKVRYPKWVCRAIDDPYRDLNAFALALGVISHEGTHLGGVRSEAVAACAALDKPIRLAWAFYNIPFEHPFIVTILRVNRNEHFRLPPRYHEVCK